MARLQAHTLKSQRGNVVIFDVDQLVGTDEDTDTSGVVTFRHPYVSKDGSYSVHKMGENHFVNIHPHTLRADRIQGMTKLPGRVPVDCCSIGVADLDDPALDALRDALLIDGVQIQTEPGACMVWFEQKGDNVFRGVIGIGKTPTLILNGEAAQDVADLESLLASVLKRKGDYNADKSRLRESVLQMHLDGCKDKRLRKIADSINLDLPRRRPKKK